MGKRALVFILMLKMLAPLSGQTGGDNIYEFLNLTHSGLTSSLGGTNVSLNNGNLNLAWHNPALLSPDMDKNFVLNYSGYMAGINYGQAIFAKSLHRAGNWAAGLTYLNYGSFTGSDESGTITGTFRANEYAFSLMWSYSIDSLFSLGADIKPVLSHLEDYTSAGVALDLGASWHDPGETFSAGLVIKNAGFQITTYAGEARQKLPFEIQAGLSQKLAHAPFRFSLTLRHLEKFDLTSGNEGNEVSSEFIENLMRHAIAGAEILPHKNFYFSAGYNYQRRRELRTGSNASMAGLSWGFGIRTSLLDFEFGRATYHPAGSYNHLSLIIKPARFMKRPCQ
jgi:hypothetical protein